MHGVMFTSLREYLGAEHGAETASRVFADEQQYVLSEAYPDDRFRALIDRAATATRLTDDELLIVYTSPRRLCALLRGVAEGTARRFGETTEIAETSCMRKGDLACRFELRLSPAAAHRSA